MAAAAAGNAGIEANRGQAGILLCDPGGNVLYAKNETRAYVPASILKILTALAAGHYLGMEFEYHTQWHMDEKTGDLCIKGFGDPLLISEVLHAFSAGMAEKIGNRKVKDIILDGSFFSPDITIPGAGRSLNPYDATTGALCANFNTIFFKWDPGTKKCISAEPQTPLLPFFYPAVAGTGLKNGRITLSKGHSRVYTGHLVRHFLETSHNIEVTGRIRTGVCEPDNPEKLVSGYCMADLVRKMLEHSNNFMANQILLTIGAIEFGPPATLKKGVTALTVMAEKLLQIPDLKIAEGSGISRQNLLTPMQMIKILREFIPYHDLMPQDGPEFYKTGTLTGVRTRAGYITGQGGQLYPFVIMMNNGHTEGYAKIRDDLIDRVSAVKTR